MWIIPEGHDIAQKFQPFDTKCPGGQEALSSSLFWRGKPAKFQYWMGKVKKTKWTRMLFQRIRRAEDSIQIELELSEAMGEKSPVKHSIPTMPQIYKTTPTSWDKVER
jgi:hypothetical protein